MVEKAALFAAGLFVWTFLEYVIHGWLGHIFQSFAKPLHAVHHRDPHAVFTVRAWMPIAAVWTTVALLLRWSPITIVFTGAVASFVGYEATHYRIHFSRPRGRIDGYLRSRHLLHHERYPDRYFGVTSALWDLVFGTEEMGPEMTTLHAAMASRPPLTGRTNLYKLKNYVLPFPFTKFVVTHPRTR